MSYREVDGQVILTMSREECAELSMALRAQQIVIHAGQFHQWRTLDICRERSCRTIKALLNRLNSGNPNYTPYQVDNGKSRS
jgi:hypothetical protein